MKRDLPILEMIDPRSGRIVRPANDPATRFLRGLPSPIKNWRDFAEYQRRDLRRKAGIARKRGLGDLARELSAQAHGLARRLRDPHWMREKRP